MKFSPDNIYHIYNRGNNKQRIFFKEHNYTFFLQKMRTEVWPLCDILAYCLMPNHFHFMVYLPPQPTRLTAQSGQTGGGGGEGEAKMHPLSRKIGTLLSSYTQAINKQENRTGSLFQQKTKSIELSSSDENYPFICFNYIHQNPLKAKMVKKMEDWQFSSFRDYIDFSKDSICNIAKARELLDLPSDNQDFYKFSYNAVDVNILKNIF